MKKIVQVCWIDSSILEGQYSEEDLSRETPLDPVYTFGALVRETPEEIIVARDLECGEFRGIIIIPKFAIQTMEELDLGKHIFDNLSNLKTKEDGK